MRKLRSLPNLPNDIILRTVDFVILYPNSPHDVDLSALCERLDLRQEKDDTTSTQVAVAEVVVKNNIFNFKEKSLKQKRGTAIDAKFALELKSYLWWRYIDDIFFL